MDNSDSNKLFKKTTKKILLRDVKECLQSEKLSNFELLMSSIKSNLLHKSSKVGEIGRSRYDIRDLPSHIDRNFTSFGLSKRDPCSCSDIIHGEYINYLTSDVYNETNMPGTQQNRGYKHPFDKESSFGKASKADVEGNKAKKLIYSFEKDLTLKNIDNFSNKPHFSSFYSSIKNIQTPNSSSIDEILRQTPVNWKIVEMKKSLSYINALRLKLKKRNFSSCFMDLYDHFSCIDKDLSCTVPLNLFYHILKQFNIILDAKIFEFLLKEFNFITENSTVYYTDALNLLNWKYEFPSLLKPYDAPVELGSYQTTYQDSLKVHK